MERWNNTARTVGRVIIGVFASVVLCCCCLVVVSTWFSESWCPSPLQFQQPQQYLGLGALKVLGCIVIGTVCLLVARWSFARNRSK
jgi:hypothetical protein